MKVFLSIFVGLVITVILIIVYANIRPPSGENAISFVKEQVSKTLSDPKSALFSDVKFYPDSSEQGDRISGYVCGHVNAKNRFGGYAGERRFTSKITVSDNGRTANMSSPFFEDKSNDISRSAMDEIWAKNCY